MSIIRSNAASIRALARAASSASSSGSSLSVSQSRSESSAASSASSVSMASSSSGSSGSGMKSSHAKSDSSVSSSGSSKSSVLMVRRLRSVADEVGMDAVGGGTPRQGGRVRRRDRKTPVPGQRRCPAWRLDPAECSREAGRPSGLDLNPRCPIGLDPEGIEPSSEAEEVGFEPTVGCPTHDFQSCRFGRSRTPPRLQPGQANGRDSPVSAVDWLIRRHGALPSSPFRHLWFTLIHLEVTFAELRNRGSRGGDAVRTGPRRARRTSPGGGA